MPCLMGAAGHAIYLRARGPNPSSGCRMALPTDRPPKTLSYSPY